MIGESSIKILSPAKINLFLHVLGRRSDGYHNLQTLFQLVETGDHMTFCSTDSGKINIINKNLAISDEENLVFKAAKAIHQPGLGVNILLEKAIPSGAGLGGGSSNAATTLVILNYLWSLGIENHRLRKIGAEIGADVPVFLGGRSALATGIGEQLSAINIPRRWYVIIFPNCPVNTREIFSREELTRNSAPITMSDFFEGRSRNDFQEVVSRLFKEVEEALKWLGKRGDSRLTGTGGSVFAGFDSKDEARDIALAVPKNWWGIYTKGIDRSPLLKYLF